jgi:AcrR family transcriptional regulator
MQVTKRAPPRPKDLRRFILDASLGLIEEGGVSALSMREVARRAKVTPAAQYYYFADRSAVIAALAEEGFALLSEEMTTAMAGERVGSIKRFEACGLAYFGFAVDHPAYMRIMFRPELADRTEHPGIDIAASAAMNVLVACVSECQETGTIPEGDPMPLALTSWATIHGLSSLWIDGPLCRFGKWAGSKQEVAQLVARTLGDLVTRKRTPPGAPARKKR